MANNTQRGSGKSKALTAFQWLSILTFALVTLQPFLGGWGWFHADQGMFDMHAMVANTIFLFAVVLTVLAFIAGFSNRTRMVGWSIALLVMVTAQMGLGYGAEGRPDVGALHIPMGVFIFGASLMLTLFAFGFTTRREAV